MKINNHNAASQMQLPTMSSSRGTLAGNLVSAGTPRLANEAIRTANSPTAKNSKEKTPEEVREKFTQFVGEAFYGQMFKAMRTTVSKPAYFNGGRAEEVFQGQLDQTMSQQLTKTTASKFADPMFEHQFPKLAAAQKSNDLSQLSQLQQR